MATSSQKHDLAKVLKSALEQAKDVPHNHIRVDEVGDHLTLTIVIEGEPLAWINYNVKQGENLIAILQKHLANITPKE